MRGYLSVKETSKILECSEKQVRTAIKDGRIKYKQNGHGRKCWILESDIKQLLGEAA
jgi:excisionase family DNA binding protein